MGFSRVNIPLKVLTESFESGVKQVALKIFEFGCGDLSNFMSTFLANWECQEQNRTKEMTEFELVFLQQRAAD